MSLPAPWLLPKHPILQFSSVQFSHSVRLSATPQTTAGQASLSITNSRSLLKLLSIDSVLPIQSSHPLSSPSPLAFNLGLISFRIDWLDLLAVQGTLKSLLQHHSSKASILWCSTFFAVQLSHSYMTTGKTIALTMQTFVSKVMSLLLNMLSMFALAFFQGANVF